MTPSFKENLITTKEAGEISGYTADYLSRLVRSGKIKGERVGHNWLLERQSLEGFLSTQGDHKIDRARALASARASEYREHRSFVRRITKRLTTKPSSPQGPILSAVSLRSQGLALAAALLVVASGALAAQASIIPKTAENMMITMREAASGFKMAFGDIPANVLENVFEAGQAMRAQPAHVAEEAAHLSARITPGTFDFTSVPPPSFANSPEHSQTKLAAARASASAPTLTPEMLRARTLGTLAMLASPSALAGAHSSIGVNAYEAIAESFAAYDSLVGAAGAQSLALGATTRDVLLATPTLVAKMNLAFGNAIIRATHAAIRAEVGLAYETAATAPKTARATVALLGGTGDLLARATARVPALATAAYLDTAAVPATLAPAIAQAVFDTEYRAALQFLPATRFLTDRYLALVQDAGEAAYAGTRAVQHLSSTGLTLAERGVHRVPRLPALVEDAYLGALGKSALAFESLGGAAGLARDTIDSIPGLAAVLAAAEPILNPAEQVALAVYEALHDFFDETTRTFAVLFTPRTTFIVPNTVATSTIIEQQTTNSFPTYTTIVQGVSPENLTQSITASRNTILSTVAGMLQPVANQVVTNQTTIQQVNMIQDLSNLIVRNGDFRGGSLTNGVSVSATTGSFDNLTGGAATLGSATISGALTVNGVPITGGGSTGNVSTSTLETAGNLPYWTTTAGSPATLGSAANLNWNNSTNLLSVLGNASTTQFTATSSVYLATLGGSVGIGTTSPVALLSLGNGTGVAPTTAAQGINFGDPTANLYRLSAGRIQSDGAIYATNEIQGSNVQATNSFYFPNSNLLMYSTAAIGDADNAYTFADSSGLSFRQIKARSLRLSDTSTSYPYLMAISTGLGVGTSTPWARLSVAGSSLDTTQPLFTVSSSTPTATTTVFHITSQGNVGIGTNSPTTKLDVLKDSTYNSELTAGFALKTADATYKKLLFGIDNTNNTGYIQSLAYNSYSAVPLSLQPNGGSVGIGALIPGEKLEIQGVDGAGDIGMRFLEPGVAEYRIGIDDTTDSLFITNTNGAAAIGSNANGIVINSSGNVGIGTTTPYAKLSIHANNGETNTTLFSVASSTSNSTTTLFAVLNNGNVNVGNIIITPSSSLLHFAADTASASGIIRAQTDGFGSIQFGGNPGNNGLAAIRPDNIFALRGSGALGWENGNNNPTTGTIDTAIFRNTAGVLEINNGTLGQYRDLIYRNSTSTSATSTNFFASNFYTPNLVATTSATLGTTTITNLSVTNLSTSTFTGGLTVGTSQFVVQQATGYIGIGTSTPTANVDIFHPGDASLRLDSGASPYIIFRNRPNNQNWWLGADIVDTSGNFHLYDQTAGSARLSVLKTSGNVGIGTTSPFKPLSVTGDIVTTGTVYTTGVQSFTGLNLMVGLNSNLAISGNASNQVIFQGSTGNLNIGTTTLKNKFAVSGGTSIGANYDFTAPTNGLIVEGNVGIGTTSPATTLSVAGSGYLTGGLGVGVVNTTSGSLQTTGTATVGTDLLIQTILNCNTAASAIQTDGSGKIVCGTVTAIGGTSAGGWTWLAPNVVKLATTTDIVGIGVTPGATSAKLTIDSGAIATTTLAIKAVSSQTANILEVYDNTLALNSVISPAGYFGIGSSSPWAQLSVNPNGISGPAFAIGSSTKTDFVVTNAGNVGIGTTTPLAKLDIYSASGATPAITAGAAGNNYSLIKLSGPNGSHYIQSAFSGSSPTIDNALILGTNAYFDGSWHNTDGNRQSWAVIANSGGAGAFTINSAPALGGLGTPVFSSLFTVLPSGNVGIGTTSPVSKLEVANGTQAVQINSDDIRYRYGGDPANTYRYWLMANTIGIGPGSGNESGLLFSSSDAGNIRAGLSTSLGGLAFYTNGTTNTNAAQRMIITAGGLVGIGTTSPFAKLAIHANNGETNTTLFAIASSTTSATTTHFVVTNAGNVGIGTASPANKLDIYGPPGQLGIYNTSNSNAQTFAFSTNANAARFMMNDASSVLQNNLIAGQNSYINATAGNLGIGTTTPRGPLHVASSNVVLNSGSGQIYVGTGAMTQTANDGGQIGLGSYLTGVGQYPFAVIKGTAHASSGNLGDLIFGTMDVGSTIVERMRIDGAGNVGIGTTSPAEKLEVVGDIATKRVTSNSGYAQFKMYDNTATLGWTLGLRDGDNNFHLGSGNFAERLTILSSNGNVGIGTTSPYAQLSVFAGGDYAAHAVSTVFAIGSTTAGTATTTLLSLNSNGVLTLSSNQTAFFSFSGGSGRALQVDGNGILSWSAAAVIGGSWQSVGDFEVLSQGGNRVTEMIKAGSGQTADVLQVRDNSNNNLFNVKPSGLVGIGTTTPYARLSVHANNGETNTTLFAIASSTSNSTTSILSLSNTGILTLGTAGVVSGRLAIGEASSINASITIGGTVNQTLSGRQNSLGDTWQIITDNTGSGGPGEFRLGATGKLGFGNSASSIGTIDIGVGRNGVNVLEVNNGTLGQYADLIYRNSTSTSATSTNFFSQNLLATNITATGTALFGTTTLTNLTATNLSTSTFAGGLTVATGAGFLGVGTAAPSAPLHVAKSSFSGYGAALLEAGGGDSWLTLKTGSANSMHIDYDSSTYDWSLTAQPGAGWSVIDSTVGGSPRRLFIAETSGNMGVNTITPYSKLQVTGTGTGSGQTFAVVNSASTTLMQVLDNGLVGIGTTTPYSLLSISNSVTTVANTPLFTIASTTGGTATTTHLTVLANGNVGIGTASPSEKLEVNGNIKGTVIYNNANLGGGMTAQGIGWQNGTGGFYAVLSWDTTRGAATLSATNGVALGYTNLGWYSGTGGASVLDTGLSRNADGVVEINNGTAGTLRDLIYRNSTSTSATSTNFFASNFYTPNLVATTSATLGTTTITNLSVTNLSTSTFVGGLTVGTSQFIVQQSTGNVGIGTASSGAKLDVRGDSIFYSTSNIPYGEGLSLFNTGADSTNGTGLNLHLGAAGTAPSVSTLKGLLRVLATSGDIRLASYTSTNLFLATNNIDRLTITGAGNVGIGTTTPTQLLTLASIYPVLKFEETGVTANNKNWYLEANSEVFKGRIIDDADATGSDWLQVDRTGTTVDYVSFPNGNVGIGTTSPWAQLSVNPNGITGPAFVIGSSTATNFLVTNAGLVGIGTTSPSQALSVTGRIYTTTGIQFPDGSLQTAAAASTNTGTAGQVAYYAANGTTLSGTSTLTISPATFVGIATSSPTYNLSVSQATSTVLANAIAAFTGSGGIGTWQTTTALATGVKRHSSVVSGGYVYVIGGAVGAAAQTNVQYAKLNANGTVGSWASTTSLTTAEQLHTSVAANGYVYALGGSTGDDTTVQYAKVNSNGTLGSWQTTTALATGQNSHSSVVANGFVYVIGGVNNLPLVQYAKLNADGTLGSWQTTSALPTLGAYNLTSVVANGYVYAIGGFDDIVATTTVSYAKLNSDGTLGSWTTTSALGTATQSHTSVVANGYVYVLGGASNQQTIQYAKLNSDGTLGAWQTATALSTGEDSAASVVANGYVYVLGGSSSGNNVVQYAPLQRVMINGTIDLLGLAGGTLGDANSNGSQGSTGGSIFAGNIFSNGTLEVTGNALLSGGLGVSGNFTVNATTSLSQNSSIFSLQTATATAPVLTALYSGNVGIGTTSPGYKLGVTGSVGLTDILYNTRGSSVWGQYGSGSEYYLSAGGAELFRFANNSGVGGISIGSSYVGTASPSGGAIIQGNVGIGTTTPNSILNVAGATPKITLTDTSAGANLKHWFVQSNAGALRFATTSDALVDNSLAALTIASTGNVGIGTSNTSNGKLTIQTNSTTQNSIYIYNPNTQARFAVELLSDYANLYMYDNAGAQGVVLRTDGNPSFIKSGNVGIGTTSPWGKLSINNSTNDTAGQPLFVIASSTASATTTHFVVTNAGNVGVGTANPQTPLDVLGTASSTRFYGNDGAVSTPSYSFANATNYGFYLLPGSGIVYTNNGNARLGLYDADLRGSNVTAYSWTSGASTISYDTNLSRLSAGVVQVGTTANNALGTLLANTIGIGTTSPWARLSIAGSSLAPTTPLFTISSSTPTATTTVFHITSQGNVGISTSSPWAKLSVDGTVAFSGLPTTITSESMPIIFKNSGHGLEIDSVLAWNPNSNALLVDNGANGVQTTVGGMQALYTGDLSLTTQSFNPGVLLVNSTQRLGIGTTTPGSKLSVAGGASIGTNYGATAPTNGLIVEGNVGIGTTSPYAQLSVAGVSSALDTSIFNIGSSSASTLTFNYLGAATSTIFNNRAYAFSFATSTTATPLLTFDTTSGRRATTTINSGLTIDGGAIEYDSSTGITSISALNIGPSAFDTDAGMVSWVDMPTATTTAWIVNSYSAQIGGTPVLTIFGTTTTSGVITKGSVGIGTTTATSTLTVQGGLCLTDGTACPNTEVAGNALFLGGKVGIGTTTPYSRLSVWGADTGANSMANFVNSASTSVMSILNDGAVLVAGATDLGSVWRFQHGDGSGDYRALFTSNSNPYAICVRATTSGGCFYIGASTAASSDMIFSNGAGLQKMRITSGGNVGIGTAAPNWTLQVASSTPYFALTDTDAGTDEKHWLLSNIGGVFRIGTSSDALTSTSTHFSISQTGTTSLTYLDVTGTGTNSTSTIASNLWVKGTLQVGTGSIFLSDNGFGLSNGGFRISQSGALTLNATSTPTVTKTSTPDFSISGSSVSNSGVSTTSNQISLLFGTSTESGTIIAGPTLSANAATGAHSIQRPDGKFLIVHAGDTPTNTTTIYDPVTNTTSAGPTLSANAGAGSHSIQRPDGGFLIVHSGGVNTTTIYDPVANTTSAGPTLSATAQMGAHAIQRPDGKFLIVHAGGETPTNTTSIYDPVANTVITGPTLSATAGGGSHSLQRPDGKFLIVHGGSAGTPTNTTTIYDPVSNTTSAGPTLSATVAYGSHSLQRPDGKFLITHGGATPPTNTTTIYDPVANTTSAGPTLTSTVGQGSHSLQRPDGKFLIVHGNGASGTTIYDPIFNTTSAGPALTAVASAGSGTHSIQRPDGKFLIIIAGLTSNTSLYDPTWVVSGSYESEDMNITSLNQSSLLKYTTNGEGRIGVAVKVASTQANLTGAVYATTTNGSLIRPATTTPAWAKVRVTLTRTIPQMAQPNTPRDENFTWLGEADTKYQRDFAQPILYNFTIDNQTVFRKENADFGTGFGTSTYPNSGGATTTGPFLSNLVGGDGGLTLPYGFDSASTSATSTTLGNYFSAGPPLSNNADRDSHSLQRPDGKFLIILGLNTSNTSIYDPIMSTSTPGPSVVGTAANLVYYGSRSIQRPDGKFLLIMGGSTSDTSIYDPIANTFTAGPAVEAGSVDAVSYGSHILQRPDGKFLVILAGTNSNTSIYDPIANTFTAGPGIVGTTANATYSGSHSIQRPDGKFLIVLGNSTSNTSIYDPIANTFIPGPALSGTVSDGGHSIQRPDGKFLIVHAGNGSGTSIYDPVADTVVAGPTLTANAYFGAHSFQRPDGKFLIVLAANTTSTSIYDPVANTVVTGPAVVGTAGGNSYFGSHSLQRPDGKYLTILGINSSNTSIYNAGWVTSGFYESEFISVPDLNSRSAFVWTGNADAFKQGAVSVSIRTATTNAGLATTTWRTIERSGSLISPSSGDVWMQVRITMQRSIPTQPGAGKNVWLGESSTFYNRLPLQAGAGIPSKNQAEVFTKPTITSFRVVDVSSPDLATFSVNGENLFRFSAGGDAFVKEGGSWNSGGADVAEYFPTNDGSLEAGDLVTISQDAGNGLIAKTTNKYDDNLLGIITTTPGVKLGIDIAGGTAEKQPVALAGRVPVKVSLENGSMKKGDYITSSSVAGVGMRATEPGRIVAIALEDLDESTLDENGVGKILAYVNPHTYLGTSFWDRTSSRFSRWAYVVKNAVEELGLTIADNGFFGIGTKTPVAKLTVQGVSTSTPTFAVTDFAANPNLVVTGEGYVGIGTFDPKSTLHISTASPRLTLSDTATTTSIAYPDWFAESKDGSFGIGLTGSSTVLSIDGSTGDVTIGESLTDGSSAKLAISGTLFASSYEAPLAEMVGYTVGSTTLTAQMPLTVLTAGGRVDLYKLATYNLSGLEALASTTSALTAKVGEQETRIASLEERMALLESGAVSSASGSPLVLGSSTLASALESFGVFIQKGIAQFNTLVFRQLVASSDEDGTSSAGSVTILTGNTIAQVNNSLVVPTTKVFVTFNSSVIGSWWVSDKAEGSFRVVLSGPQATDVSFDYFLVQTVGQIATSTPDTNVAVGPPSVSQSNGLDTVPPVITLLGDNPMYLSVGGTFNDPGVTITDNAGGPVPYTTFINGIEQEVAAGTIDTASATTYLVTYRAMDTAGNISTAIRSIIVGNPDGTVSTGGGTEPTATSTPPSTDVTPPVVTLTGAAALEITVGDTFTDPGATAIDDVDGDISAQIVVAGEVNASAAGLYTLTYTATDAAGSSASVSRVVTVVAPAAGAAGETASTTTP